MEGLWQSWVELSLLASFFQYHLFTLGLCIIYCYFLQYSKFFIIIVFVMANLWSGSLILPLQLTEGSGDWLGFFFQQESTFIKVCTFFRHNAIGHLDILYISYVY